MVSATEQEVGRSVSMRGDAEGACAGAGRLNSPRRLNRSPLSRTTAPRPASFGTSYAPGPGATEPGALKRLAVCAENMDVLRGQQVDQPDAP